MESPMAEAVNTGMPKGDMKKLLIRSKAEPVNCAVGVGSEAGYGLFMMHRSKDARGCERLLKTAFPEARSLRWGTAFVDVDDNPKLVKLTLNAAISGMAKRITRTLQGTGFNKVVIMLEDGSTVETHDEGDAEVAPSGVSPGAAPASPDEQPAAGQPIAEHPAAEAAPAAPTAPTAPPLQEAGPTAENKTAEIAKLQAALAALASTIPKVAGADDDRKAVLLKLARDANVNIKTGNLIYAANFIEQLKIALQGKPAMATLQVLTSSRQAWTGTQQRVKVEVDKLRGELAKAFQGETFAAEISAKFNATTGPVLEKFDDRLLDLLDDAMAVPEGAEREALITQGRAVMKEYLSFAMTDALIGDLDANPFVPLAIRDTVIATLAALSKSLH